MQISRARRIEAHYALSLTLLKLALFLLTCGPWAHSLLWLLSSRWARLPPFLSFPQAPWLHHLLGPSRLLCLHCLLHWVTQTSRTDGEKCSLHPPDSISSGMAPASDRHQSQQVLYHCYVLSVAFKVPMLEI